MYSEDYVKDGFYNYITYLDNNIGIEAFKNKTYKNISNSIKDNECYVYTVIRQGKNWEALLETGNLDPSIDRVQFSLNGEKNKHTIFEISKDENGNLYIVMSDNSKAEKVKIRFNERLSIFKKGKSISIISKDTNNNSVTLYKTELKINESELKVGLNIKFKSGEENSKADIKYFNVISK